MAFSVDWHNLRTWSGSQQTGFEKLCCQLAAHETVPDGSRFIAKAAPDAGIECYWIHRDKREWGFQAKFFLSPPGDAQWKQIDESVQRALEAHPFLARYTICMPVDRPDPRIKNQKSFMDRWKAHEKRWKALAAKNKNRKGRTLRFEYWGTSEFLDRLARPEHRGRVYFWFQKELFTTDWFARRVDSAVSNVGARYTPALNIDLPIAAVFDGLCRTPDFFVRFARLKGDLKRRAQRVGTGPANLDSAKAPYANLQSQMDLFLKGLQEASSFQLEEIDFNSLQNLIRQCRDSSWECLGVLREQQRSKEARGGERSAYLPPVYSHEIYELRELLALLGDAEEFAGGEAARLANVPALLLRGDAGTGKTHLLCDIAKKRIEESGAATVVLLGKHFLAQQPWPQIMQMLGLACSAEEFLGGIEAAAEADEKKALIIIDGLNEGEGRFLWHDRIAGLLSDVRRYPWLSVAVSVRTSYETVVVREELATDKIVRVTHEGFAEHEYQATRTFFEHYKIQRPTVPLLAPEFENPLFLKLFCEGLANRGLHEMPPGLSGLTAIFNYFTGSINEKLSKPPSLDFDEKAELVQGAVRALASSMAQVGKSWLDRESAKQVVDAFLPGRTYERSLFRHLVSEGVLAEDRFLSGEDRAIDIVQFTYERFGDHLLGQELLRQVSEADDKDGGFRAGGKIATWFKDRSACFANKGLLEALSIHVPETLRKELAELLPAIAEFEPTKEAFLQSLAFRDPTAVSAATLAYIQRIVQTRHWYSLFLESILLVTTNPEHSYNARFLHSYLIHQSLADRDRSWSLFLLETFGQHGTVDRLLEWSTSPEDRSYINDNSLELCGVALSWFLTSSHRHVRDRATKGLVRLFQNRLPVLQRVMVRFLTVNDPYVAERLYAVAYGASLRTTDLSSVGALANQVYAWVFKDNSPPVDILLRDYARGVIECAVQRGAVLGGDLALVRPPYGSEWPQNIPPETDLRRFDEHREGMAAAEYARLHLYDSVMGHGDFARYIMGTNFGSSEWSRRRTGEDTKNLRRYEETFDLSVAQRFVFNRVLELGWTTERFGEIDIGITRGTANREEAKPERFGKKYQWIAFHECLARIADNFIFIGDLDSDLVNGYQGPWQISHVRDVDPSCLVTVTQARSNRRAWWSPVDYGAWETEKRDAVWLRSSGDLPAIKPLLVVSRPQDASEWIVLECLRDFDQPAPPDAERFELPRRRIWLWIKSYLVRKREAGRLQRWLVTQNLWGRWMPESSETTKIFLGEFFWAPAYSTFNLPYYSHPGWIDSSSGQRNLPAPVHVATEKYMKEMGYDGSIEDTVHIWMPSNVIAEGMDLRWNGTDGKLFDRRWHLIAEDPTIAERGPHAVLVRKQPFLEFLKRNDLAFLWTVLGEKQVLGGRHQQTTAPGRLQIGGSYRMVGDRLQGRTKAVFLDLRAGRRRV